MTNLRRVASVMVIMARVDTVISVGASLVLFGKLHRINDIFEVSLEIRRVGACALLTSGECSSAVSSSFVKPCISPGLSDTSLCAGFKCGIDHAGSVVNGVCRGDFQPYDSNMRVLGILRNLSAKTRSKLIFLLVLNSQVLEFRVGRLSK